MAELIVPMTAGYIGDVREYRFEIDQEDWNEMDDNERLDFQDECERDAKDQYAEATRVYMVTDNGERVDL